MNFIKLFEKYNYIEEDIKEILWEVSQDNGIHVKVGEISRGLNKLIVTLGDELYDLDIVAINVNKYVNEFLTLNDYMKVNGFKLNDISYDERGELIYLKKLYHIEDEEELLNHLFQIPVTSYIRIYFK